MMPVLLHCLFQILAITVLGLMSLLMKAQHWVLEVIQVAGHRIPNPMMFGSTNEGVGTIQQPAVAVYTGTCRGGLDEEACSTIQPGDPNILELTITNLIIGRSYFLRVDGRDNNVGSFRLCLRQFNPPPSPEADCSSAVVLCDQSSFLIENLNSTGQFDNEVDGTCVTAESASSWYKWTADQSGTLEFTLTPNNMYGLRRNSRCLRWSKC